MFTWICPKCGREVPPAYTDCPNCNPQPVPAGSAPPPRPYPLPPQQPEQPQPYVPPAQAGPAPRRPIWQSAPPAQASPYAAPPQQPSAPPQQAYAPPPPQQAYAPTQSYIPPPPAPEPQRAAPWSSEPPPTRGLALPTWLLAILFTVVFAAVLFGAYRLFGSHASSSGQAAPDASLQMPVVPTGDKANPYQKFIEISGIRFAEDPKNKDKSVAKFVITNHADDEISGLSGSVAIVGRGDKSGQPVAMFNFTTSLGPEESKDLTTPLTTKLKAYELPDWQFAQPVLQITAPGGASGGSQ